jgi:hypothetical protein
VYDRSSSFSVTMALRSDPSQFGKVHRSTCQVPKFTVESLRALGMKVLPPSGMGFVIGMPGPIRSNVEKK